MHELLLQFMNSDGRIKDKAQFNWYKFKIRNLELFTNFY